jgi:hypothetical protein
MIKKTVSLPVKLALFVLTIPFKVLKKMIGMGLAIILPIIMLRIFTSVTGAWKSKLTGEYSHKAGKTGNFVRKEK